MEYVTLNNDVKMPILNFGVYQIPQDETKEAVLNAIKVGYRGIDTAQSYFNEKEVGDAIKECGIPREQLFITTKVWIDHYGYEKCKKSIEESLAKLQTEYIDLVLLHQPFSDYYGAYRVLEELYEEGKIKAIGVSNFYADRLADICLFERKVVPAVNQIETNPMNARFKDQEIAEKYGTHIMAWAPFGEGKNNMFTNETLVSIGNKYGKSAAQVILRWLIQRGVIIACKSTHLERIQQNFEVFDFELSEEDMETIKGLDTGDSLFFNHQDPNMVEWFDNMVKVRREQQDASKEKKNWE
ncbi:MAG: aldo/keto reductase [Bacilli bacterium]|nr:aldo/keto reductase [Bacilli bacterium]